MGINTPMGRNKIHMPADDAKKIDAFRKLGYSYRQIASELGKDKMTVFHWTKQKEAERELQEYRNLRYRAQEQLANEEREKARFAFDNEVPGQGQEEHFDPLNTIHALPPGGGSAIVSPFTMYSGVFRGGAGAAPGGGGGGFYIPADQAIIQSRENSRAMYQNLIIREALQSRSLSVAESEWHVQPCDHEDEEQIKMATEIQKTIESIPGFLKMLVSLLQSRFFGWWAINLIYKMNPLRKLYVADWIPIHGDSLSEDMTTGELGVYVAASAITGAHKVKLVPGWIGQVHVYEDGSVLKFDKEGLPYRPLNMLKERDAIILMRYDRMPSDFLDPRSAGGITGLGLRSVIYPSWLNMMEFKGMLTDWCERIGGGTVMYKYKINNRASYNQAQALALSQSNQAALMVPVDILEGSQKPIEGVEIINASAVGLDNFMRIIQELWAPEIRRMIVGQDSTSQPATAGLGSKIAEVHENSFSRICQYDAKDLEQTLTHQLVRVIQQNNFPGTEQFPCKFVIDFAKPNVKEQIDAAKILYEMGVSLDEDEVRKAVGFSKPKEGAAILKKEQGMPGLPGENPFGNEEKENPFAQDKDAEHKDVKDQADEDTEKKPTKEVEEEE